MKTKLSCRPLNRLVSRGGKTTPRAFATLLAFAALGFPAGSAVGAEIYWASYGLSSEFNETLNWEYSIPGSDDVAINQTWQQIDINADWAVGEIRAEFIPTTGYPDALASFYQHSWTVATGALQVGHLDGSTGAYTLANGTLNVSGSVSLGKDASNRVELKGGAVTAGNMQVSGGKFLVDGANVTLNNGVSNVSGGVVEVKSGSLTVSGNNRWNFASGEATRLDISGGSVTAYGMRSNGASNTTIALSGTGSLTVATENSYFGNSGSTLDMTLAGSSRFTAASALERVGLGVDENSSATFKLHDSSNISLNAWRQVRIGDGVNSQTAIELNNNSAFAIDGTVTDAAGVRLGAGSGAQTTLTLNDQGRFTVSNAGARLVMVDGGGSAKTTVNLNDSSAFVSAGTVVVGHYDNSGTSSAVVNVNDTALFQAETLILGRYDHQSNSPVSTINLNGGTLAAGVIQQGGGTAAKTINVNGGTLRALAGQEEFFTSGYTPSNGTFTAVAGHATVNIQAGGLTFDTQDFTVRTASTFNGTGALTKTGTGALYLNGGYTGGTTFVAGGTLGGTGTMGDIVVRSGAALAPGNSVGTLAAGNVILESGATLLVEYHAGAVDALAAASVAFETGSVLFIAVTDGAGLAMGQVVDFFGGEPVDLSGVVIQSSAGYQFAYVGGALQVAAVPEPSTYALLGALALLGAAGVRRRGMRKGS